MARLSLLVACAAALTVTVATHASAQTGDFPFALPEPVLNTQIDEATGAQVATLGMSLADCAAHFTGLYAQAQELAPGYTISGYGTEPGPNNRRYVFGILHAPNTLLQLSVSEADGNCVVRLGNQPWIIQTDEFRWSWAPLPLLNGETLNLDPLLQAP
jgi:hypothetical protein